MEREEEDPITKMIDNANDLRERLEKDGYAIVDDTGRGYLNPNTLEKGPIFGLDGTVYTQDKDKQGWTGWSPEVLELARKHNESCEKPKTEVSTSVDKSAIKLKPGTHT